MAKEPQPLGAHQSPVPSMLPQDGAQPAAAPLGHAYVVDLSVGPVRRLTYRSVVSGHVTCVVEGAEVSGSAGVPLGVSAAATASTADEARHEALSRAFALHAAGFWDASALSKHPPQPPHGTGPGPWARMRLEDSRGEVWMPAARLHTPFRLSDGRVLDGDHDGLASAASLDTAKARARAQQVRRRGLLPLWRALEREVGSERVSHKPTAGAWDVVVSRTQGLSLAVSFRHLPGGPVFGLTGLGCAGTDTEALSLARTDRMHTEALLRLQEGGVWGGHVQDRPPHMDVQVHRLAWEAHTAAAMATLVSRWRARAEPGAAGAHRSRLAWTDLTPPSLREMGLSAVRFLWLDGEGEDAVLSPPAPPSRRH